jgi:hypothetical protein
MRGRSGDVDGLDRAGAGATENTAPEIASAAGGRSAAVTPPVMWRLGPDPTCKTASFPDCRGDGSGEATAKLRLLSRRRGRHSRLRPRDSSRPGHLPRSADSDEPRPPHLTGVTVWHARARAHPAVASGAAAGGHRRMGAAPSLSPSPAINPATGWGRCQRWRREAGGFAVPGGDGGGARWACVPVPWLCALRCQMEDESLAGLQLPTPESGADSGGWAPPLVPASPSAYLRRAIRVDAGMPDAWTCCRPDGWNEIAFWPTALSFQEERNGMRVQARRPQF